MPQYIKTTWVDGTAPALNATNLNKMEQGIFDCIRQDGSTTMSAQLVVIAGSATTPSISPTGDSNNGIFFPSADVTAISTAGTERVRVTSAGDVGIGVVPSAKLHVKGTTMFESTNAPTSNHAKMQLNASATVDYGLLVEHVNNGVTDAFISVGGKDTVGYILIGTNTAGSAATTRMTITSAGDVGIGTGSPSYQLQVNTDSAAKPSTNTWTIASDSRIKNVTGEYTKGLDAVCALRPITYQYNGKAGFSVDGKENISIIAQEAIEHFPECVGTFQAKLEKTDETETELYNWNGHALTFALVNAIKELKAEVDSLKAQLKG